MFILRSGKNIGADVRRVFLLFLQWIGV